MCKAFVKKIINNLQTLTNVKKVYTNAAPMLVALTLQDLIAAHVGMDIQEMVIIVQVIKSVVDSIVLLISRFSTLIEYFLAMLQMHSKTRNISTSLQTLINA